MDYVFDWVKSGLIFGIFSSVILLISPNKSYMKHIGMVVGLLFILVILHPIMELFHIDSSTYSAYVKNVLRMESNQSYISSENIKIYEESVEMQIMAIFSEYKMEVEDVRVVSDDEGKIDSIYLKLENEISNLEKIDLYLKNMFGEEVNIEYEI